MKKIYKVSKLKNTKGNIIVFALAAVAIMSLSAVVFSSSTAFELRKSSNVKHASFAVYQAESTAEQSLYLIRQALLADKSFDDIKDVLKLPDYSGQNPVPCGDAPEDSTIDCQQLTIALGVNDLPINLKQNQAMTVDIFDLENRNSSPYPSIAEYDIDQLVLEWSGGEKEFEISFIVWNVAGAVDLLAPMRRRVSGTNKIIFNFNNICNNPISPSEAATCSDMGGTFVMGNSLNLGKIRIRLLSADSLVNGILRLCKYNDSGTFTDNCDQKLIPGFIEINSTGAKKSNKQKVEVIQQIKTTSRGSKFVSEIWDYAIFSQKSLSK